MTRAARKRKLGTIILSDSEEELTGPSLSQVSWLASAAEVPAVTDTLSSLQSTLLRQPLQFSQSTQQPSVPRDSVPATRKSVHYESKLLEQRCITKSSTALIVQKKKVGEVKDWLLAERGPSLLLLSGPTGCGKTCTVRVLAAEHGYRITEWTTPTPTLWAEHVQQRAAGIAGSYSSKLDDFEDFVSHAKLGSLPLCTSLPSSHKGTDQNQRASQSSLDGQPTSRSPGDSTMLGEQASPPVKKLLLVEDLPNFADAQQRQRLADLLGSIAGVAKCRVVITATVSTAQHGQDRASAASSNQGLHKELLAAVDAAGAAHISFNPLTKANIDKALQQVSMETGFSLPAGTIGSIADSANGDLRNALEALQLAAAGLPFEATGAKNQKPKAKRGKKSKTEGSLPAAASTSSSSSRPCFGKDTGLALFHALGKILYNKRPEADGGAAAESMTGAATEGRLLPQFSEAMQMPSSSKQCELADRHQRPQLGVDPEAVLLKSGLDTGTAAAFLHENMLEFVDHNAVEDAAEACTYLSDAARMMDQSSGHQADWNSDDIFDGQSMSEAAAGSTVVRGLLYSLMRPAARRFLSLKSPALFTNNKAATSNKEQLQHLCWAGNSTTGSARVVATDSLPFVRRMTAMSTTQGLLAGLPKVWSHIHNGDIVSQHLHGQAFAGNHPLDVAAGAAALSGLSIARHELPDDAIESD